MVAWKATPFSLRLACSFPPDQDSRLGREREEFPGHLAWKDWAANCFLNQPLTPTWPGWSPRKPHSIQSWHQMSRAPDCLPWKSISPIRGSSKAIMENPRADNRPLLSFLGYQTPPQSLPSGLRWKFRLFQGITGFPHTSPHPKAVLTIALYWGIFPSLKTRCGELSCVVAGEPDWVSKGKEPCWPLCRAPCLLSYKHPTFWISRIQISCPLYCFMNKVIWLSLETKSVTTWKAQASHSVVSIADRDCPPHSSHPRKRSF